VPAAGVAADHPGYPPAAGVAADHPGYPPAAPVAADHPGYPPAADAADDHPGYPPAADAADEHVGLLDGGDNSNATYGKLFLAFKREEPLDPVDNVARMPLLEPEEAFAQQVPGEGVATVVSACDSSQGGSQGKKRKAR
jgi:hypothetical protein